MLFLQYHHIHTTFGLLDNQVFVAMSHIHGYFKIVSLCYRNSSVCWFCCEPGVFLPAIPLDWLGRRQSKNTLSGGGAELEKGVAVIGSVVLTIRLRRSSSLDFEDCWGTSWEGIFFDKEEESRSFALKFG